MFDLMGSNKYSADKFYTKSTDGNGHYEQVRVKLSPSVQAMCEGLAGEFGEYDSVAVVIRDALLHRLVYVRENFQGMQTDLDAVELERQQSVFAMMQAKEVQRLSYIETLERTLDELCRACNWEAMGQTLTDADDLIDKGTWPEGPLEKLKVASDEGWASMRSEIRRKKKASSK